MVARVLDDITVGLHYLVMAYIVLGGFVAWRWRWTMWLHLLAITWAAISLIFPVSCPLTGLENYFRHQGGLPSLNGGFINTYLTGVLYPAGDLILVQVLAGIVVLVAWAGIVWRPARRAAKRMDHATLGQ